MASLRLAYCSSMGRSLARVGFRMVQTTTSTTTLQPSLRGLVPHTASPYSVPVSLSWRRFANSAAETAAKEQTKTRSYWWYRFAAFVRYVRIPALVLGVYSLGYQQGIMDCTKTPKMLQDKILNTILVGQGVTDMSHVKVIGDWEIRKFSGGKNHHVAQIGQRIILAAREHIQEKLDESMAKVRAKLPEGMAENLLQTHYGKDEDCRYWYEAGLRLLGETEHERPWHYVFIQTALPNAFVTEMLPQRFFITTGLLEMAESADEIAFVLGHEVSHLVLGHVSQANRMETMMRTVEVLLLSIDPTSGVLALFFIGGLAALRSALSAAHSRDNERQADDLGIEIAARACFDTVAGAEVMRKMYHMSTLQKPSMIGTGQKVAHLYDSHPPSQERYESLLVKASEYNKHRHTHCHGAINRFFSYLWNGQPKHVPVEEAMEQVANKNASE